MTKSIICSVRVDGLYLFVHSVEGIGNLERGLGRRVLGRPGCSTTYPRIISRLLQLTLYYFLKCAFDNAKMGDYDRSRGRDRDDRGDRSNNGNRDGGGGGGEGR